MNLTLHRILAILVTIILALAAGDAKAIYCASPAQRYMAPPGNAITIDHTTPNGMLWTNTMYNPGVGRRYCDRTVRDRVAASLYPVHGPAPGGGNFYKTGIDGLVIRFRHQTSECTQSWWPRFCTVPASDYIANAYVTVELHKIGPITRGGTLSGEFGRMTVSSPYGSSTADNFYWNGTVTIKLSKPTCSVTVPDLPVTLDQASVSQFTHVGATGQAQPFDVVLSCGGGGTGSSTVLKMGMTDQLNTSNVTTSLTTRANGGDARGVGVQVLRADTPQVFGPAPTRGDEANVWTVQTVTPTSGEVRVPLKARLVRTGTMQPGVVNASAQYTLIYN